MRPITAPWLALRSLSCAALAFIALALGTGSAATAEPSCADATLRPNSENLERIRAATLCLLNAERAKRDLAPLRVNDRLGSAAQAYSAKMVRRRFFAHVCPQGSTLKSRSRSAKYLNQSVRDYSLGENLAWGSGSLSTPRSIVRGWMRSHGHRSAILNAPLPRRRHRRRNRRTAQGPRPRGDVHDRVRLPRHRRLSPRR